MSSYSSPAASAWTMPIRKTLLRLMICIICGAVFFTWRMLMDGRVTLPPSISYIHLIAGMLAASTLGLLAAFSGVFQAIHGRLSALNVIFFLSFIIGGGLFVMGFFQAACLLLLWYMPLM